MDKRAIILVLIVAGVLLWSTNVEDVPLPPDPKPDTDWSQLADDIETAFLETLAAGCRDTASHAESGTITTPRKLAEACADDIQDAAIAAAKVLDAAMAGRVKDDVSKSPAVLRGIAGEW